MTGYKRVLAERQYGLLTAVERLALVIDCEARGDSVTRDVLMQTAPRRQFSVVATYFHSRALLFVLIQDRAELLELLPELVAADSADFEEPEFAERMQAVADTFAYLVLARAAGLRLFLAGLGLLEPVVDALLATVPARDGWEKGIARARRRACPEPAEGPLTTAALLAAAEELADAARAAVEQIRPGEEPAQLLTAERHAALLAGAFEMVARDI